MTVVRVLGYSSVVDNYDVIAFLPVNLRWNPPFPINFITYMAFQMQAKYC